MNPNLVISHWKNECRRLAKNEYQKKYYAKCKAFVDNWKRTYDGHGGCVDCFEKTGDPYWGIRELLEKEGHIFLDENGQLLSRYSQFIECDHQENKSFNISEMYGRFGLRRIGEELAKCQPRCGNHHKLRTFHR